MVLAVGVEMASNRVRKRMVGLGIIVYGLKNAQLFKRCTKKSGSLGVHDCC